VRTRPRSTAGWRRRSVNITDLINRLDALRTQHGNIWVYINEDLSGEDMVFDATFYEADDEGNDDRVVLW
jgi:hypothetical protein